MNKWEKEVQQSLLKDEQRVLKVLKMAYADVLRETNDRMADLFARITADPTDSAAVYQFRHQQSLRAQLEKILDGFQDNNYRTISEYLEKSYENGYLGAMYDIHKQGIPIVTPINQENVVRAVTLDSKISVPMYTRLGNNIAQLKTAIAAEVTRGAVSGSMWKDVAARISDKGNVAAYNAMRIARTEGHRIQCAAQMDACRSAKDAGADIVRQWDSTMDDRTRETHRQLHGQLREMDVPFAVNGMTAMYPGAFGRPEEDIHCRCALLQRARWALSDAQLQALRETDAAKELAGASGFEDFKGKYLDQMEKLPMNPENPIDNSGESGIIEESSKKTITAITDAAIERVPKVAVSGFSDEQCSLIQQNHKNLLGLSRSTNGNKEVAFVLNSALGDRKQFLGEDDRLEIGALYGRDLFVMHNHPRNSSYSATDIIFLLQHSEVSSFSIVKNNGGVEVLTKTQNYNADELRKDFQRIIKKQVKTESNSEYAKAVRKLLEKHSQEGGMLEWIK